MNFEHFIGHVRGPLKEAGVDMPDSKMGKVRTIARRCDGQRFDIPSVAKEVAAVFSGSIGMSDEVVKKIEKNLRKGPFY